MLYKEDRDIPYTEHDEITPMNDYARHKAVEERMLEAKGYNIVRLPVMMGPSLSLVKNIFMMISCPICEQENQWNSLRIHGVQ